MSRVIDLAGEKFGEWTVLERAGKASSGNYKWLCECSCGNKVEVDGNSLRGGRSTGCRRCAVPHNRTEYSGDPIQTIWAGMKQRCYDPNQARYERYGGRGIYICDKWLKEPKKFYEWAYDNGYYKGMSIDRINNDKGYSPENCRIIPLKDQGRNRRSNRHIEINGEIKIMNEWCKIFEINRSTVRGRLKRGWNTEDAFKTPVNIKKDSR